MKKALIALVALAATALAGVGAALVGLRPDREHRLEPP